MDKKAVAVASASVARAEASINAMEAAKTFSELESQWSDFLLAANRVFTKLEQGAKTAGNSQAWFGRKKHERRKDVLLRYIHHARNADEHTLSEITERTNSAIALGVGPGAWQFDGTIGPGGTMKITTLGGQVPGRSKFVEVIPAKVRMIRVVDKGDPYDPPCKPDGSELHPIDAAKLALAYLQRIVEEASKLAI